MKHDDNHCKINREFKQAKNAGKYQEHDISTAVIIGLLTIMITATIILGSN